MANLPTTIVDPELTVWFDGHLRWSSTRTLTPMQLVERIDDAMRATHARMRSLKDARELAVALVKEKR